MASGFHKAFCTVCKRNTWHTKWGNGDALCTDHSSYPPKRKPSTTVHAVQQGSLYDRKDYLTPTEATIQNRLDRSLWRIAEDRRSLGSVIKGLDANVMFPSSNKDPNKQYCTFCGNELQEISTLTEKRPVIRFKQELHVDNATGEVHVTEKVTSRAEEFHACPNCVLKVQKPVVVRRG